VLLELLDVSFATTDIESSTEDWVTSRKDLQSLTCL
jgi:hypothetical protein